MLTTKTVSKVFDDRGSAEARLCHSICNITLPLKRAAIVGKYGLAQGVKLRDQQSYEMS